MQNLKPIIIAANGIADNEMGNVRGTPGFIEAIRLGVSPQSPLRQLRVLLVNDAAKHMPLPRRVHIDVVAPRLERARFTVEVKSLADPCFLDTLLGEPIDVLYLNTGCAIAMSHYLRVHGVNSEKLTKIRERVVIVAIGGSASALGFGSLRFAKKVKATHESRSLFNHRLDWYGRAFIKTPIITQLPVRYPDWLVQLFFPWQPIRILRDGEFAVIP